MVICDLVDWYFRIVSGGDVVLFNYLFFEIIRYGLVDYVFLVEVVFGFEVVLDVVCVDNVLEIGLFDVDLVVFVDMWFVYEKIVIVFFQGVN